MADLVLVGGLLTFGNKAITPDNLQVTSSGNVVTITKLNANKPAKINVDLTRDTLDGDTYATPALFIAALAEVIPVAGGGAPVE